MALRKTCEDTQTDYENEEVCSADLHEKCTLEQVRAKCKPFDLVCGKDRKDVVLQKLCKRLVTIPDAPIKKVDVSIKEVDGIDMLEAASPEDIVSEFANVEDRDEEALFEHNFYFDDAPPLPSSEPPPPLLSRTHGENSMEHEFEFDDTKAMLNALDMSESELTNAAEGVEAKATEKAQKAKSAAATAKAMSTKAKAALSTAQMAKVKAAEKKAAAKTAEAKAATAVEVETMKRAGLEELYADEQIERAKLKEMEAAEKKAAEETAEAKVAKKKAEAASLPTHAKNSVCTELKEVFTKFAESMTELRKFMIATSNYIETRQQRIIFSKETHRKKYIYYLFLLDAFSKNILSTLII